jgi:hypothetical protein
LALRIRERPPLRLSVEVITPAGRRYRWAEDEPRAENVFADLRWGDSVPGGYKQLDGSLPRKQNVDYSDLVRLSDVKVWAAGGEQVGEYRLEDTPRTSGDHMAISPSAVGWQAHTEDDKSARAIIVDRDMSNWSGTSTQRQIDVLTNLWAGSDGSVADDGSGNPAIVSEIAAPWATLATCLNTYDMGPGLHVGPIYADMFAPPVGYASPWSIDIDAGDTDHYAGYENLAHSTGASYAGYYSPISKTRRFLTLQFWYNGSVSAAGGPYKVFWRKLAVYGDHGLTRRGSDPGGFYASDVIPYALRKWAPLLRYTEGPDGTIQPTTFVIPQLAFREQTTVAEIVKQTDRFHLRPWAVWNDRTFYYQEWGMRGRRWYAPVGPARLEETGPSVRRLWNGIVVEYQDVDGTTKTVGPPGSGCDVESTQLVDPDPLNPANQRGIRRWDKLVMNGASQPNPAIEVGRIFLSDSKLIDGSGKASLVGYVQDDRGVTHPYSHVKSGDLISFPDAADSSYRRIVNCDKDRKTSTASVDLDAPPEGLQALLERLGVRLVSLGL